MDNDSEEVVIAGAACPLFTDIDSADVLTESEPNLSGGHMPIDTIEWSDACNINFFEKYRMKRPAIIKNMCGEWPALSKWTEGVNICNGMSTLEGTTLLAKDNKNFLYHELCDISSVSAKDAIHEILDHSRNEASGTKMYTRLYLDNHPNLLADINTDILSQIASGNGPEVHFTLKNVGVWISSMGCITPLHYDLCHGFLCQIVGRKHFLLASPEDTPYLYRNNSIATKNQTSSEIDIYKWLEHDDYQRMKYPNVDEVQFLCADLCPGDVLYTPPGWWHAVTSIDTSVSVLVPFDMKRGEHLTVLQSL